MTHASYAIARIFLPLLFIVGASASASAWWDRCCDRYYDPPPVYVYTPFAGATWTSNGWAHLPSGAYYAVPVPPPHFIVERRRGYFGGYYRAPILRPAYPVW